jgi:phytoene synthase
VSRLDGIGEGVRRHDPDRFLTALFAPPERRAALLLLYAFNHELARAREVAREPMLALIRLQWWREVLAGAPRRHALAERLHAALAAGALDPRDLGAMVDGREAEAAEVASLADFQRLVRGTAGAVAVAAGRALGAEAELARLATLGTAYGIAGQLRNVASLARQGRSLLPHDLLAAHGPAGTARELAGWGRQLLAEAGGRVPRPLIAAALPAVLARRDLRRAEAPPVPRGFPDRAAVLAAFLVGRV